VAALSALERAALEYPDIRADLELRPDEETLVLSDSRSLHSSPAARLDAFAADAVRFMEYNAESPAGAAYADSLSDVFESLPVMREFRRRVRIRRLPVEQHQVDAVLDAYRQWGGSEQPTVAIVDWPGLPTVAEFELFVAAFQARGVAAIICEPASLEHRHGALYAGGVRIHIVYRRVLASELLARHHEGEALISAYLAGEVCVVNPFRAKLLHKKLSFAMLSDDRYAMLYTAAERRAVERHIPWTRKVRDGATTWRGREVPDLVRHVVDHREQLVIKPNDDYGGRGVTLGWLATPEQWEAALRTALAEPSVVQEAVPVPTEPFPVVAPERRTMQLCIDTDPYLFQGRMRGCLTRVSSSALMNVTAGAGSVVPSYVLEEA
jgi:uncharacterized circularly permuted ATP-grasp superfamily protein